MSKSLVERVKLPVTLAAMAEKKELVAMSIRRATKEEFIRVHPELVVPNVALLSMRTESTMYVVDPELVQAMGMSASKGQFSVVDLHLAVSFPASPFFLPVRHGSDDWAVSSVEIAELAKRAWVRVTSDRTAGHYEATTPENQLPEPEWPTKSLDELLEMALKFRFIDSPDHDVLKRLRGAF